MSYTRSEAESPANYYCRKFGAADADFDDYDSL